MAEQTTYNLPESFNKKENAFLALMAVQENDNMREVGRKLVDAGMYKNEKNVYNLLKNPLVRSELETIRKIKQNQALQLVIKGQVILNDELERIAKLKAGKRDKDRSWVSMALNAAAQEQQNQTNIQINFEERRKRIKERAEQARKAGREIVVNDLNAEG